MRAVTYRKVDVDGIGVFYREAFRVPLALHRLVLSQGQTPVHPGSIQWGNVTPTLVLLYLD